MNIKYNVNEISKNGLYRIGAGAVIEKNGLIFCAYRSDANYMNTCNTLSLPQGGVEDGEDINKAVFREIFEETGILESKLEFIRHTENWIYYDVPRKFGENIGNKRGQTHIWFHFKFLGSDEDVDLNIGFPEFSDFFWKKPQEIVELSIDFKQSVHRQVFTEFGML